MTGIPLPRNSRRFRQPSQACMAFCLSPEFARMGAFAYATGFKNFDKDGKTNLLSKGIP